MTRPAMKPCPLCGRVDGLSIMNYDGWRQVECNARGCPGCYLGPARSSMLEAVRAHNAKVSERVVIPAGKLSIVGASINGNQKSTLAKDCASGTRMTEKTTDE